MNAIKNHGEIGVVGPDGNEYYSDDITSHPDYPCDVCGSDKFANPLDVAVCVDCLTVHY